MSDFFNTEFDPKKAQDANSDGEFKPIPPGEYPLTVKQVEVKTSNKVGEKGNKGRYVKVQYQVSGPEHNGRVIFANYNVVNDSEIAQKIGRAQFAELQLAAGLPTDITPGQACQQLGGRQIIGRIGIETSSNPQYGDQNKIKKHLPFQQAEEKTKASWA